MLESMDLPLGVVLGTFGVERHQVTFRGQAAHAGSTPMDQRRDALAAAGLLALEIYDIAEQGGGVCTMGSVVTKPGHRHLGRRDRRVPARPAQPRRGQARLDARSGEDGGVEVRRGAQRRGRVGACLEHRADPLRRGADRARRRVDPRGRRHVAPPAERPAPRRRRGLARRRSRRSCSSSRACAASRTRSSRTRRRSTSSCRCRHLTALPTGRLNGSRRDEPHIRHDRDARSAVLADARADPARRAERLRVRLDVRLAHPLAGVVRAAPARRATRRRRSSSATASRTRASATRRSRPAGTRRCRTSRAAGW